jgi:hypothetical protein
MNQKLKLYGLSLIGLYMYVWIIRSGLRTINEDVNDTESSISTPSQFSPITEAEIDDSVAVVKILDPGTLDKIKKSEDIWVVN